MVWLKTNGDDCHLSLFVQAGTKASGIVGEHGSMLKVRVAAVRTEGLANAELIRFLADLFSVSKSEISIIKGEFGKYKIVKVRNLSSEAIASKVKWAIEKAGLSLAKKK